MEKAASIDVPQKNIFERIREKISRIINRFRQRVADIIAPKKEPVKNETATKEPKAHTCNHHHHSDDKPHVHDHEHEHGHSHEEKEEQKTYETLDQYIDHPEHGESAKKLTATLAEVSAKYENDDTPEGKLIQRVCSFISTVDISGDKTGHIHGLKTLILRSLPDGSDLRDRFKNDEQWRSDILENKDLEKIEKAFETLHNAVAH